MVDKKSKLNIVEEPDLTGTYTARDYLSWQFDELVELIRGKIYRMAPSPSSNHQDVSTEIGFNFRNFFDGLHCRVFHAPFDVYLVKPGQDMKATRNVVEPDLCIICDEQKIIKKGCLSEF